MNKYSLLAALSYFVIWPQPQVLALETPNHDIAEKDILKVQASELL